MNNIDKYLKATKELVIQTDKKSIEDRILKRISNIKDEDKNLLDDKFLDFLKKSNSRLYLFTEKVLNNPGKFALILLSIAAVAGFAFILFRNFLRDSEKEGK